MAKSWAGVRLASFYGVKRATICHEPCLVYASSCWQRHWQADKTHLRRHPGINTTLTPDGALLIRPTECVTSGCGQPSGNQRLMPVIPFTVFAPFCGIFWQEAACRIATQQSDLGQQGLFDILVLAVQQPDLASLR